MLERIDLSDQVVDIFPGWTVESRTRKPGPPERVDGMTVGYVTMREPPPHKGEMHPDGDEILILVSGRIRVIADDHPPCELNPGEACIVRKNTWHQIECLEESRFLHLTPGPRGEARF